MARAGVRYDVVSHPHSHCTSEAAELAHVSGDCVAKSVVLEDEDGLLMAVLPSTFSVRLGRLSREMNRRLRLATEDELQGAFPDCSLGAVPPLGPAYGIRTIVDDSLETQPEVYFEAGDHERLVHVTGEQFRTLMRDAGRGHFARKMRLARW